MDRIDIVLIHDIGSVLHKDRHPEVFRTAMDDGYRALHKLKDAGAVMAIGIGDNQWQVNLEQQFDTPLDQALWRALKNEQLVRADAPTA